MCSRVFKTFQAFVKTKHQMTGVKDATLVLVTEDLYESVIRFMRANYIPHEPICAALGCDKESPDWKVSWMSTLKMNMSLALQDKRSMEIIGMFLIGIAKHNDKHDLSLYEDDALKSYLEIMDHWDSKGNVFTHYNVTEVIAFREGSISVNHRRYGLAHLMVKAAVQFVKNLGVYPIYIRVEGSSNYSKSCIEKNGFKVIYDLRFDKYLKDGRQVLCDTGIHTSMTVYGQCISAPKSQI